MTARMAAKAFVVGAALIGGPAGRVEAQGTALDVALPLDVSGVSGVVAVEIDGVDMTDFVRVEPGRIVVGAGAPLAPGRHEAIVYVLNGASYEVFATYSFETSGGAGAPTSSNATVSVTATHEAGGRTVNGEGETYATSGGEARVETLDESVTAWVTYSASSREDEQLTGRAVDIAEYSIELRRSGALLDMLGRIGHQTLSYDRALIADVTRRGLSFEAAGPGERLQFALFGLKSSQALGADNILGLSEDDDRMFGGHVGFRPFWSSDLRFSVQAYEGDGPRDGGFQAGTGDGASLAVDGSNATGRLRYNFAYGRTTWDDDGEAGFLDPEDGEAWLATVDYDLLPGDTGRYLTLTFDYERVDLFYYSLANPGLPTGAETYRMLADYAADRLTLTGELSTSFTNVGGDPNDPTDRVSRVAVDGTWLLYSAGFLSDTSLTFGASYDWARRHETPPAAPPPEDWDTFTAYVGLDKVTDTGGWGLRYTYLDDDDQSPFNLDFRSHEISGWWNHDFNDRLGLTSIARVALNEEPFSGRFREIEGQVSMIYALDPGRWNLALDMGLTETDEIGIESGAYVAGEVAWSFSPSADLVFNAGYYDGAYAVESGEDHDAIVGLALRLNTNYVR